MNLVLRHSSEFPAKLRRVISETPSDNPTVFLEEIYNAAKALLNGLPYVAEHEAEHEIEPNRLHPAEEAHSREPNPPFHWWHGLDNNVDTENQAEVVIRLFPNVLCEKQKVSPLSSLNNTYPIYALLFCSKSLHFIPLFAELGTELALFPSEERAGLCSFMRNVLYHLVYNNLLKDSTKTEGKDYKKLDATYTKILKRLAKQGLMLRSDIYDLDLVPMLLRTSTQIPVIQTNQRLSFLIDLDPSILMDSGMGESLLYVHLLRLQEFLVFRTIHSCRKACKGDFTRFCLLFQLGMANFPKSLGFVFHRCSLPIACEIFGTQQVTRVIDDELRRSLLRNSFSSSSGRHSSSSDSDSDTTNNNTTSDALRDLVFAACGNKKISLDGVYTLFRHDPICLLPKSCTCDRCSVGTKLQSWIHLIYCCLPHCHRLAPIYFLINFCQEQHAPQGISTNAYTYYLLSVMMLEPFRSFV